MWGWVLLTADLLEYITVLEYINHIKEWTEDDCRKQCMCIMNYGYRHNCWCVFINRDYISWSLCVLATYIDASYNIWQTIMLLTSPNIICIFLYPFYMLYCMLCIQMQCKRNVCFFTVSSCAIFNTHYNCLCHMQLLNWVSEVNEKDESK